MCSARSTLDHDPRLGATGSESPMRVRQVMGVNDITGCRPNHEGAWWREGRKGDPGPGLKMHECFRFRSQRVPGTRYSGGDSEERATVQGETTVRFAP